MSGADAGAGGPVLRPVPGAGDEKVKAAAGGDQPPIVGDERLAARIARAERYLNDHLKDRRGWYSSKASEQRELSHRLSLTVVICGGLITFTQVFSSTPAAGMIPAVTAALGVLVMLASIIGRIWNHGENWPAYRKAAEKMTREYRLFINDAGPYKHLPNEDQAYRAFVESVESIISEEQQLGSPK